jgi:hypothetical protein
MATGLARSDVAIEWGTIDVVMARRARHPAKAPSPPRKRGPMDDGIGIASRFAGVASSGLRAELRSLSQINDACERGQRRPIIGHGSLLSQG